MVPRKGIQIAEATGNRATLRHPPNGIAAEKDVGGATVDKQDTLQILINRYCNIPMRKPNNFAYVIERTE